MKATENLLGHIRYLERCIMQDLEDKQDYEKRLDHINERLATNRQSIVEFENAIKKLESI